MNKPDIKDLSYEDLKKYIQSINEKAYRVKQIFEWVYQKEAVSFNDIKNLSKDLRIRLSEDYSFKNEKALKKEVSSDGTQKLLVRLSDGENIEVVLIPTEKRTTVCVSTQVGCKFGCKFCASQIGGFKRNLSVSEIVQQITLAKRETKGFKSPVTHVVFMGIGEPLDNYDNVLKAIRIINHVSGFNIGARRITVSTCGVIPEIKKLVKENIQFELAISLHGFDEESRNKLMPVNKKYPFEELMHVCSDYAKQTNRKVTFEYVLIKDVTMTLGAVRKLKKYLKGYLFKMNLIPLNNVQELGFQAPSKKDIIAFKNDLAAAGIAATIRFSRGIDISGACGQLRHRYGKNLGLSDNLS